MSDSPSWLDKLSFLLSPGAYISSAGLAVVAAKLWPTVKEWVTRSEKQRELREEADRTKTQKEREALQRDREQQVILWRDEVANLRAEIIVLKREEARWKNECDVQRALVTAAEVQADFERVSGQRYYEIARRAYQLLLDARSAWREGKPPPTDDLVAMEDLTGTARPVRPD